MTYKKEDYKMVGVDVNEGYVYFSLSNAAEYNRWVVDITPFIPFDKESIEMMLMLYPEMSKYTQWIPYALQYWDDSMLTDYSDYYYIVAKEYDGRIVIG